MRNRNKYVTSYLDRLRLSGGAVYIESIATITFLMTLFMGAFQVLRLLEIQHQTSMVSREIANAALRDCTSASMTSGERDQCLDLQVSRYSQLNQRFVEEIRPVVSLYSCVSLAQSGNCSGLDPAGNNDCVTSCVYPVNRISQSGSDATFATRFPAQLLDSSGIPSIELSNAARAQMTQALDATGSVVVAEAFAQYPQALGYLFGGHAYHPTILFW